MKPFDIYRQKKDIASRLQNAVNSEVSTEEALNEVIEELIAEAMTKEIFVARLFNYRDLAHLHHLKSQSHSEHLAFGSLYEFLSDFIDSFVESLQSEELLDISLESCKMECESLECVKEMLAFVKEHRYIFTSSFLQNEIDNLEKMLNTIIYKLTFLK